MIEQLKEYQKAYELANGYYYEETVNEEEYKNNIGRFKDYTPLEISNELIRYIKTIEE